jgi:hypothetical protein
MGLTTHRLPPAPRSDIESWAKQQNDKPSRSEAIRRLTRSRYLAGCLSRDDAGRAVCLPQDHLARRGAGDPVQGEVTVARKCVNCETRKGMTRFEGETFTSTRPTY